MSMPTFTMRNLLEAGVHFGHTTRRWNPKMKPFLFGARNGIHIIDLEQTVPMLHRALEEARTVAAGAGRILFVATKRQAQQKVAESAIKCGQYYVNYRWLGGMMTNWQTVSNSIKHLKELEEKLTGGEAGLTKKELLGLERERDKLERTLGGIKEMGNKPDLLFVIDTNKEAIAIQESQKLGIPVIAVLDSNSDPDGVDFPIPGNDDATRSINLYCDLMCGAILDGLQQAMTSAGQDAGEAADPAAEIIPEAGAEKTSPKPKKKSAKKTDSEETKDAKPDKLDKKAKKPAKKKEADKAEAKKEVKKSDKAEVKKGDKKSDETEAKKDEKDSDKEKS